MRVTPATRGVSDLDIPVRSSGAALTSMYAIVKTDGLKLARQIEKIRWACGHLKAAGTGRSKEGAANTLATPRRMRTLPPSGRASL